MLAQPAYRIAPLPGPAQTSLWEVIWDWLVRLFSPLEKWFEGATGSVAPLGLYIGLLLIAFALGVVALLLWRIVNAWLYAAPKTYGRGGVPVGALPARNATEWRRIAQDAAAAGDYARAIGARFSAALAALDERALVPFDPARTPGEYRRLVRRARQSLADPFDALSGDFVRAAFAAARPERDDYLRAERSLDALLPALAA